jgi:hypothetical protein
VLFGGGFFTYLESRKQKALTVQAKAFELLEQGLTEETLLA